MQESKKRQSDATSDETLEDLEEETSDLNVGRDRSMPSPDGAFDEDDELSEADPE
jgi:hypothetical protein